MPSTENSKPSLAGQRPDPEDSLTDEELEKQLLMSSKELKELGLLTRDDLVLSMGPSRRLEKPAIE